MKAMAGMTIGAAFAAAAIFGAVIGKSELDRRAANQRSLPLNSCIEEKRLLFPEKTSAQIAALCELLVGVAER